jgi:hypothetical protein
MSLKYRMDNRTKVQFAHDIKTSHFKELEIAIRIAIWQKQKNGKWPHITPNGHDTTGKVEKTKKVSLDPDFIIGEKKYEITRSSSVCQRYFHQKVGKVKKCIDEDVIMVFVNGFDENEPNFTLLDKDLLQALNVLSIDKYGGPVMMPSSRGGAVHKNALRYDMGWITTWHKLPILTKTLPKEYTDLLKSHDHPLLEKYGGKK